MNYLRYSLSFGFGIILWLYLWQVSPEMLAQDFSHFGRGAAIVAVLFVFLQLLTAVIYRYYSKIHQKSLTLCLSFVPPLLLYISLYMSHQIDIILPLSVLIALVAYRQFRHVRWWIQGLLMIPLYSLLGPGSVIALAFFVIGLWKRRSDVTIAPLRALVLIIASGLWIYFSHGISYLQVELTSGILLSLASWIIAALLIIVDGFVRNSK